MAEFLDEMFKPEPEAAPQPEVEVQPEVAAEPIVPEPQPEPAPPPSDEPKHVPLATFLDTRDELKEAKRRLAEFEAKTSRQPAAIPDVLDDPEGYGEHIRGELDQKVAQLRFEMSDAMARQVHGPETVEKAVEWAQEKAKADPMFAASYMRDPNPIDWIVRQHKRDATMADIGDDVDAFVRRRAAELGLTQTATVAAVPASPPAAIAQQTPKSVPPRSIASEASSHSTSSQPGSWMDGFIR